MIPREWEEDEEDGPWIDEYDEDFGDDDGIDDDDDDLEDDDDDPAEDEEDELEDLIAEGDTLLEEGEYEQALGLFREAAERFPESPLAVCKVGHANLMLFTDGVEETSNWEDDDDLAGWYEEALTAFDAALSIDEEFVDALNGQGALYMLADKGDDAIECWQRSLEIDPDQADIAAALADAQSA